MQDRDHLLQLDGEVRASDSDAEPNVESSDFVHTLLKQSYERRQPGSGEMRHGTEGWQALESSFVVRFVFFKSLKIL